MISEERKELNRQRIIDVSTELFVRQGIAMTTLAQIARESNVVCRTVSNIFGSKGNLVLEDLRSILQKMMNRLYRVVATPEYGTLTGLEQILCILRTRGALLMTRPAILLLLNEIKVWAARSYHDGQVVKVYTDNLKSLYRMLGDALDKGHSDGSINPVIEKKQALSILGPAFRAVIQQLALAKINPEFSRVLDVEEELEIQLSMVRDGLRNHNR